MKINKKMSILGIVKDFPGSVEVLQRFNMHCADCGGSEAESIEKGAQMHGLDPDLVIEELNKLLDQTQEK